MPHWNAVTLTSASCGIEVVATIAAMIVNDPQTILDRRRAIQIANPSFNSVERKRERGHRPPDRGNKKQDRQALECRTHLDLLDTAAAKGGYHSGAGLPFHTQ
jgi:hypothetical protein